MADKKYISKVVLPSGADTYYIKDQEARELISGGITFNICWSQTDYESTTAPTTAKRATIPNGVTVYYNNGASTSTGTLTASSDTKATFYLIYSKTQAGNVDMYEEYVTVENGTNFFWEKIGDTQIDLSNVVTDVTYTTDSVIGSGTGHTVTQPTITLATDTTSGTGKVQVVTGITSTSASGDNVTALTGLGTASTAKVIGSASTFTYTPPAIDLSEKPSATSHTVTLVKGGSVEIDDTDSKNVLSGVQVTAQPTVTLASGTTGDVTVATGIGGATTRYLSASASNGSVSADSTDVVTVLTSLGTPATASAASSVTPTTNVLETNTVYGVQSSTTSVTGVQSTTTTASKATVASSTDNSDFLKNISVSNETLTFGASSITFADVTVPIKNASATTVPIKNTSATRYATGGLSTDDSHGGSVVTNVAVGDTVTVVTGYTPSTDTVLGTDTGYTVTQPTISLTENSSTATGRIQYVKSQGSATTTKLSATASGTAVGANGTALVMGTGATFTFTPTNTYVETLATSSGSVAWNNKDEKTVVTGYTPTTDTVLGTGSTITVTPETKYVKATAAGTAVSHNNADTVDVVKTITVTKGNS